MENSTEVQLSQMQVQVAEAPPQKAFLEGPAGTGKTTAGVARLLHWAAAGVPAGRILVLTPQRTLAGPYYAARRAPALRSGGLVDVATVGALARRMIDLFWPLVVEEAGFGDPDARPTFLTLETAQYYMARIVAPLVEQQGYFEAISIDRNRLYSQVIDNLNKSAVVGFPLSETAARLRGAWVGESAQARVFEQAQECAEQFRRYCLAHNLLDFSLQLDVFFAHLWPEPLCRDYLVETYTHLLLDNVEEDTPVAHDMVYAWLPRCAEALVIYDHDAGYRAFLGADPQSAVALRDLCDARYSFSESYVTPPALARFGAALGRVLQPKAAQAETQFPAETLSLAETLSPAETQFLAEASPAGAATPPVLHFERQRFHPQMLDWVADETARLVREGVPPGEIVVLAPFLTDALRFALTQRLEQRQVPVRSHRPSRALREEPATRTLLTLAALAHPAWSLRPTRADVSYALMQSVAELDLVRAHLLGEVLYRVKDGRPELASFDAVTPEMQQRITYVLGGRYEALRQWVTDYTAAEPLLLDHFLARLFGEVLSQPGYGFHRDFDAANVAAVLIESVQKFRWIARDLDSQKPLGQEYLEMVQHGVIAAQYVESWQAQSEATVLLAPAYTFLLSNRPVAVQFWLNVGGHGWWERLYQPLTHPHVLSRHWPLGQPWNDAHEFAARQAALRRLVMGLVRRCRSAIYLGLCEIGEQGYEQEGALLRAVQRVLKEGMV